MWDEGWRPGWLALDTGITPRGGNSWAQPKPTNGSWGLVPGTQATRAGSRSGWSPCPAVGGRKSVLPAVLPFKAATTSPSGASVPTAGDCSGQTGCQEDRLVYPVGRKSTGAGPSSSQAFQAAVGSQMVGPQTGAMLLLGLQFQARKPLHLLFQPFQWWTDVSNGRLACAATLLLCWYLSWYSM